MSLWGRGGERVAERGETTMRRHGPAEKLAGGEVGSVDRCACGCLHLHIGALTLRLHPDAFRELAGVLREAAKALATEAPALPRH
jgi:hypothetical protein